MTDQEPQVSTCGDCQQYALKWIGVERGCQNICILWDNSSTKDSYTHYPFLCPTWEFKKTQTNQQETKQTLGKWKGQSKRWKQEALARGLPTPVSCESQRNVSHPSVWPLRNERRTCTSHMDTGLLIKGGRLTGLVCVCVCDFFFLFLKKGDVSSVTILIQTEMEDSLPRIL